METKDKSKKKAKKYEKEKKSSIKEDMEFQSAAPRLRKTLDKKCEENEEKSEKSEVLKVAPSGPTLKGKPDTDQKSLIVSKQKFDGSWDLIEIAYLLGISLQTAQQATPSLAAEEVWATALGIAFLEVILSKSKASWEMVAKKARAFITKALMKGGIPATEANTQTQTIVGSAVSFIQSNF